MILPSIDLMNGQAVQLVGGERHELDAGPPEPIAERFGRVGEIAVVDLDAALGQGSNAEAIEALCRRWPCRVGGGIRSLGSALRWLDAGAEKIVIGTAAEPELLSQLPKERIVAALDCRHGEVVVDGWRQGTGSSVLERIRSLRDDVGGFLVTFVELEGRLGGTALERVPELVEAAGNARVTIAGGITTAEEVATLDSLGADAQVGMALYKNELGLAEAFTSPLSSDRPDGLWPTVVTDEDGRALGLCYSNLESVRTALDEGAGVYWSRQRGLWRKGESSGARQELMRIDVDCDRDTLRFMVRQEGAGFCHLERSTCFGPARGISALERTLQERRASAPAGSYSARLFSDPELLASKLAEEARELATASGPEEVRHEAADVLYFTATAMRRAGVSFADVARELDQRALRITRRPGNAKPNESEGRR